MLTAMTWVKGNTGNPMGVNGHSRPFKDALILELKKEDPSMPALRRIARKVTEMAEEGNLEATKFIAERLDGKVPQQIDATLRDERDLSHLSEVELKERIAALEQRLSRRVPVLELKPNGKANGHGSPQDD